MTRLLLALLLAAPLAAQPPAEWHAPVPRSAVGDNDGVRCAWLSLAALADRAGHPALAADARKKPGPLYDPNEVARFCRAAKVDIDLIRDRAGLDAFLTRHVTEGRRPCAVGVYDATHVVLVTHFEAGKRVGTVGNGVNNGEPKMWTWDEWRTVLRPDGLAYALPDDGRSKAERPAAKAGPAPAARPHPSAVRITSRQPDGVTDGGSGVVVGVSGGRSFVVTNEHVLGRSRDHVYCYLPSRGAYAKATVERADARRDVAVLSVPGEWPACGLAADVPPRGTRLTLWGFPAGREEPVAKAGEVVGFHGEIDGIATFTTTVRSVSGDSGGGQFDDEGRLVCLSRTGGGSTVSLEDITRAVTGRPPPAPSPTPPPPAAGPPPASGPLREQPPPREQPE